MMTKTETAAVVYFDNIVLLNRPVRFSFLREKNCVSKTNLVTAQSISSGQLQTIVSEGLRA